ncbi:amidohydrolase family protein [Algoriphagus formosus]|uniref:amidohydrolase family protein n=1 Tax=Algoriphagus formosus TaxID=2007308 RepID=UPI003F6F249E
MTNKLNSKPLIIDVRCRYTGGESASYYRKQLKKSGRLPLIKSLKEGTEESFFEEIEQAGVTTAVSASGYNPGAKLGKYQFADRTTRNDDLADIQKRNPRKFIACGGIDVSNSFHHSIDEIQRCFHDLGIKVFGIEPGRAPGCNPDDPILDDVYQTLQDINCTVIIQTSGLKGGKFLDYAHPGHIERVAEKFPYLRIICAHGCYPYVREAIVTAMRRDNIWLSPEGYLWHLGYDDWLRAINKNFEGFSKKFLFGTAYPLTPIKAFVDNFRKLPIEKEFFPNLLYKNAIDALGLNNNAEFKNFYDL